LEVIGDFKATLHLGIVELSLKWNMYPFKFTPFDALVRMDALYP